MASIAFVRCYLANGDRFHDITHGMCADWFLSLSPAGSPAPVSGVWADVPQDALHGPIVRCSFNVYGYIEWRDHEDSESEDANEDSEEEDGENEDSENEDGESASSESIKTRYRIKRRCLREHRVEMRAMWGVIEERGLEDEVNDATGAVTGNTGLGMGMSSDMDEDTGAEDPEETLVKEVQKQSAEVARLRPTYNAVREHSDFFAAAALMASRGNVDLERARMALEDMRSRVYVYSS